MIIVISVRKELRKQLSTSKSGKIRSHGRNIFQHLEKVSTLRALGGDVEKHVHFQNGKIRSHGRNIFQHLQEVCTLRALGADAEKIVHFQKRKNVQKHFSNIFTNFPRCARLGAMLRTSPQKDVLNIAPCVPNVRKVNGSLWEV